MVEEELFIKIGNEIDDAIKGQLFGKPCFKMNGKAFICFFQNEMVFKLFGDAHREALALEGSHLFDPSGNNRAMKQWVQVSYTQRNYWRRFAQEARNYVAVQ
ncbi:hypothetical protein [Membranihabitans marinus]|uniref:hypothetical protein n=1 Tax=Membranihabitans marinus TaxID=1227546 RepID=UPI001F176F6C|nr:hypothetical protein [Membranihabitans marinus]